MQAGRSTLTDLEHPLRNPGFTLADLALVGGVAAKAGRLGATAARIAPEAGTYGDLYGGRLYGVQAAKNDLRAEGQLPARGSRRATAALAAGVAAKVAARSRPGSGAPTGKSFVPPPLSPAEIPRGTSQGQTGALYWGGRTFTTRRSFDRWAQRHGTSTDRIMRLHPTMTAIYSTLRKP